MQRLEYAVGCRRGEGQFDVTRERLGGADLRELCIEAATPTAEKLRRQGHQIRFLPFLRPNQDV